MSKSQHKTLCGTKASRAKLAARITALVQECGATVAETDSFSGRGIALTVTKMPWSCNVDLEGGSNDGAFLGHWYHDGCGDEKLPDGFASAIRGSVNEYHRRKATTCEEDFDRFLESLERGLKALSANLPQVGAALAAKCQAGDD